MRLLIALVSMGLALGVAGSSWALDNPAMGKALFKIRCATCHQSEAAQSGPAGPSLKGIVGRKVAALPDFSYSSALKTKGGVWSDAALDAFLASPVKFAPGGKMFSAVTDSADRAHLIAYLKTQK